MQDLLTHLTHAIEGTPAIALSAAVLWGILSILLSPCHLASIPLIVGFRRRTGVHPTRRAFALSLLFATGILVTIALIGILTATAGRMLGDLGPFANYAVALIFFVVGLHLLDVIPLPLPSAAQANYRRKGLDRRLRARPGLRTRARPLHLRLHGPHARHRLQDVERQALYGALLLAAYGVGHCGVIVLAGTSTEWVERLLHWNNTSSGTRWLKRICGLLVLVGGLWLLHTAP
jgi:cytochrome c-type biogenesis protein